jgi:hypothetical protein
MKAGINQLVNEFATINKPIKMFVSDFHISFFEITTIASEL